jgi:uncharacterized protein YggE
MSMRPALLGSSIIVAAALLAASVSMLPAASAPASEATYPRTIAVTGLGEVKAKPDMAVINSGVVSEAPTAHDALAKNNNAMASVIDALKKAGVAEEDIQTSNFSVSPQYPPYQPNQTRAPRISGYQVSNQVTVRVKNLAKLGGILDTLVQVGANQINGISFDFDQPKQLQNDARKLAVADARAKAELYASATHVTVGRVLQLSEAMAIVGPQPMAYAMDKVAAPRQVPIAEGQQTLSANVTIVYEIQ